MIDSVSSVNVAAADLGELIPPSHLEPDDGQPGMSDSLAYLNKWDPPSESDWRRATWVVARELIKGIAGSNWAILAKLELLSARRTAIGPLKRNTRTDA
jgi:hypothetical protein